MSKSSLDQELSAILLEQIEVEAETLEELEMAEKQSQETAVRLMFMEMRFDTAKHKKFLESVIEMLETTPCDEWSAKVGRYIDRVNLQRDLESFIEKESKMIGLLEQALERIEDPLARFLLLHLKDDEESHHSDLKELVRLIQIEPLQKVKGVKGTDIVCETDDDSS
jgi:rubrerythrin